MNKKDILQYKTKIYYEINDMNKIRYKPKTNNTKLNEEIKKKKFQYKLMSAIINNND